MGGTNLLGLIACGAILAGAVVPPDSGNAPAKPAECAVSGTLADGNAERGEPLYTKHCVKCHGATGDGQGKVVKRLRKVPGPLNTKVAWDKTTDMFKFQSTKCGGKSVGKSDDMPDYPELTDQQIWDVLAYAKTLQQSVKPPSP